VNDRCGIDFGDAFENSSFQFLPRLDSDVSQESAGHLAEERLDDVEPGAMLSSEHLLESVRMRSQKGSRFFGDVRRMIVQYDPDRARWWVPGIEVL
jgi:hypothetical protein